MYIGFDTLQSIEDDRNQFIKLFFDHCIDEFKKAGLKPLISEFCLADVHFSWLKDMQRVLKHEAHIPDGLDHIKRIGHLVFWFRRFNPIYDAECLDGTSDDDPALKAHRDFLMKYMNEYVAFDFGMQFCNLYHENSGSGTHDSIDLSNNFINNICYVMKHKSISPHALSMIYYSIFCK